MSDSRVPSRNQGLLVLLDSPKLVLAEIGQSTSIKTRLTNTTAIDQEVIVRLLGSLSGPTPATQHLVLAKSFADVEIVVVPPPALPPGQHQLLIEVLSKATGNVIVSQEVSLEIQETKSIVMHVSPASISRRIRGRISILIRNHDDVTHHVRLRVDPDDPSTKVEIENPDVTVMAGQMIRVKGRIKLKPFFFGKVKDRWFSVVADGSGLPIFARAQARHSPVIGKNIRSLMTLMSILFVWGVLTAGIISAIKPVTTQSAAGAEGPGVAPTDGNSGNQESIQPPKATVSGAITAVPDGSGTVIRWDEVCIGDAGYIANSSSKNSKVVNGCSTSNNTITDRSTNSTAEGAYAITVPDASLLYLVKFSKKGHTTQSRIVEPNGKDMALDITLIPGDGLISGTTVDETGTPIGGVTVSLTDGTITYSTVTATTGAGIGTFNFANLSTPATYVLDARADGRGLSSAIYDLPAKGKRTNIQLALAQNIGALAGAVTSARFEGSSAPPVEVTVTDGSITRSTTTLSSDLTGVFRLDRLPLNQVLTVTLTSPGFTTVTKLVTLTPDSKDLQISLEKSTGSVNGILTFVSNPGNLTKVAITISNSNFTYKATNKVESNGNFDIQGIEPGHYVILFQTFGATDMVREADVIAGSPSDLGKVDLVPTSSSASSGSINLLVTTSDGNTSFASQISIKRDDPSCPSSQCNYSGAGGAFNIQNVGPGGYIIDVIAEGYETKRVSISVGSTPTAIPVPVVLSPLGSIQGQVTDITGSPIEGIDLQLHDANGVLVYPKISDPPVVTDDPPVLTNSTGFYAFPRKLKAGTYTIRHIPDEFTLTDRTITGAVGVNLNVDLVVNVKHLVTGKLERLVTATSRFTSVSPTNVEFYRLTNASWTRLVAPVLSKSIGVYKLAENNGSTDSQIAYAEICAVYHDDGYLNWNIDLDKTQCSAALSSANTSEDGSKVGESHLPNQDKNLDAIYIKQPLSTTGTTFKDFSFSPKATFEGFVYPKGFIVFPDNPGASVSQRIAGAVVSVKQGIFEALAITDIYGNFVIYDSDFNLNSEIVVLVSANQYGTFRATYTPGIVNKFYVPLVPVNTEMLTTTVSTSGVPVSGAVVNASPSGLSCITNNLGQCVLNLPYGEYTLTVSAANYEFASQDHTADSNADTLTIPLTLGGPRGSLLMVVRNAIGITQSGIKAQLTPVTPGVTDPDSSQSDGAIAYAPSTIPPGDYTITLTDTNTPPRFVNQSFLVHINSNQTTSLLIDLAAVNTVYIPIEVVPAADFGPATPYPSHVLVSLYKTDTAGVNTCSTAKYTLVSSATSAFNGSQEIATFSNISIGNYYVVVGAGCNPGAIDNYDRLAITNYPIAIDSSQPSQWMNPIRLIRTARQVTASASIGGTQSAITSMSLSGGFLSSDSAGVATGTGSSTTYVFSSVPPGVYTLTMVQSPYPNRIERITVGDANLVTSTYAMDATQRTITVTVNGPSSGALATLSNGLSCTTVSGVTCTISNVPDGTYTLTGSASGYTTNTSTQFTTGPGSTTATVALTANAATTRSVTFTSTGISGVLITVGGVSCTTVNTQCTISDLALTALTYAASKTGYVTQTGLAIAADTTTATVALTANP